MIGFVGLTEQAQLTSHKPTNAGAIQSDLTSLNSLSHERCLSTDANDVVACMERSAIRVGSRGAKYSGFCCAHPGYGTFTPV